MRISIVATYIIVFEYAGMTAAQSVQSLSLEAPQQVKHLSQDEINRAYHHAYKKMQTTDLDLLSEFRIIAKTTENDVGDTLQFNMLDYSVNEFYKLRAVLKAKGAHTQVWVDVLSIDSSFVTDDVVNQILTTLEEKTGEASIDPDKGIYQIDVETFGDPPNYDGDGLVDFLITDIRDGMEGTNTYVAGFFTSWDQTNQGGSNKRDILYIDSKQGIYQDGNYNTFTVMGTVAHEFQHLIHYKQDSNEVTFINEAMSELAGTLCGYGISHPGQFLDNPNKDLTSFNNEIKDYAAVNLWAVYIYEQFGITFIHNFVASSQNGKEAFDATLADMGITTNFNEVFQNWTLCNYINDIGIDARWGYQNPLAQNLQAAVNTPFNYPMTASGNVVNYGAFYYKFSVGENLTLTLTGDYIYAKYIRNSAAGIEVVDLPIGSLYEDNEFGTTVTEGVVLVSSVTGGSSFTLIADAESTVELIELSHDDGTSDPFSGTASFLYTQGTGKGWAVKYTQFENTNNNLVQIKLYGSRVTTDQGELKSTVWLHIWGDNGGNPGNDLVTPVLYELTDGWNTIECQQAFGQQINLPAIYYLGFTNPDDETGVALGMDNSQSTNYTWVINPADGNRPMSDLQLNDGTSLSGFNMMVRALISIPYVDTRAEFSVGLAQNPVFSENIDIYILGKKRLDITTLIAQATVGGVTKDLTLASSGTSNKLFVDHSYVLKGEGNLEINIQGKNLGSRLDIADTTITMANVVLTRTDEPTIVTSPDSKLLLSIPENVLKPSQYVLLAQETGVTSDIVLKPEEVFYTVYTTQEILSQSAEIAFTVSPGKSALISIKEKDGWRNLEGVLKREVNTVYVRTTKLGTFRIELIDSEDPAMIVDAYRLDQNFPNPFNPETSITFSVKDAGLASLTIYNILGQKVKSLINQYVEPAVYTYKWDGTNSQSIAVPTGIYLYQLRINGLVFTKKMALIR
jgi:hypothetical protein